MRKVVAIIQARLGSRRLPNKVLEPVAGLPLYWHVYARAVRASTVNAVVVAIPDTKDNDRLVASLVDLGIPRFGGSADDVLDRYFQTARDTRADVVVRLTGDCPLMDPAVIDQMVRYYLAEQYDYVSNTQPPTWPDGCDVEVMSFRALERCWMAAMQPSEREHVTAFIHNHPDQFRVGNVENAVDLSDYRFCVDEQRDLDFVRAVMGELGRDCTTAQVVQLLEQRPWLRAINGGIGRNEGYIRQIEEEDIGATG